MWCILLLNWIWATFVASQTQTLRQQQLDYPTSYHNVSSNTSPMHQTKCVLPTPHESVPTILAVSCALTLLYLYNQYP